MKDLMRKAPISKYGSIALGLLALVMVACSTGSVAQSALSPTPTASNEIKTTATATPATAAPIPSPIQTATPTPVPGPTISEQESAFPELVTQLSDEAMDFLKVFTNDVSPRASTTDQERAAAEFLVKQFEMLGYQAELQSFTVDRETSSLQVVPPGMSIGRDIQSFPMTLSGVGKASGILVNVGKAFEEESPRQGLAGKIALIQRGTITFEQKVSRVAEAGAAAAIVYNNGPGLFRGTLSNRAPIPAISISREDGQAILELMTEGDVEATASVAIEASTSQNVIAEKPGTGGDGRVVVLGGHYDTVPDVPGANDNGSGIAALMTLAKEVADEEYRFTLRFIGFGAEELGLLGSRFYVDELTKEEIEATIAMLNFDALGTGPVVGVEGDSELVTLLEQYGKENGVRVEQRFGVAGVSSDHGSFQEVGIPVAFFVADDISRIHTLEDKLEFVQPELMGKSAALGIALLDSLAAGP